MDWNKVRNSPGDTPETRLELIETCWRMGSSQKATRILSCGIYRDNAPGLEVRAKTIFSGRSGRPKSAQRARSPRRGGMRSLRRADSLIQQERYLRLRTQSLKPPLYNEKYRNCDGGRESGR